jgi:hypothetical protein
MPSSSTVIPVAAASSPRQRICPENIQIGQRPENHPGVEHTMNPNDAKRRIPTPGAPWRSRRLKASRHRGHHLDGLMDAHEIVVHEAPQLLNNRARQPRQRAAHYRTTTALAVLRLAQCRRSGAGCVAGVERTFEASRRPDSGVSPRDMEVVTVSDTPVVALSVTGDLGFQWRFSSPKLVGNRHWPFVFVGALVLKLEPASRRLGGLVWPRLRPLQSI